MLEMFVEYLKELMLNGSARGKLEHLVLGMDKIYDYYDLPEYFPTMKILLQCLEFDAVNEPIIDRNDLLRFYILEIDGGFAVIVMKTSTCEVQFIPKADRQSLYEVFVRELFWRIPVDPSAYYDAFMAAESEEIAFSELAEEAFAVYFTFAREIDIEASNFWSDDSDVSDMEYDADEENVSSEEELDSDDDL